MFPHDLSFKEKISNHLGTKRLKHFKTNLPLFILNNKYIFTIITSAQLLSMTETRLLGHYIKKDYLIKKKKPGAKFSRKY